MADKASIERLLALNHPEAKAPSKSLDTSKEAGLGDRLWVRAPHVRRWVTPQASTGDTAFFPKAAVTASRPNPRAFLQCGARPKTRACASSPGTCKALRLPGPMGFGRSDASGLPWLCQVKDTRQPSWLPSRPSPRTHPVGSQPPCHEESQATRKGHS